MDTTLPQQYRGFDTNTTVVTAAGIAGCQIDSIDISDVDVVQFQEKRSLEDGLDTGQVFLGGRRLRLAGTLFDLTRALLFDRYLAWRAAFSPTLAQGDSPADHGYVPYYFSVPTNNTADFPSAQIDMQVFAMAKASQAVFQRRQQGGNDEDPLAIPWQATLVMKDPRIYSATTVDHAFTNTAIVTGATAAASTDLVTETAHGLSAGQALYFTTLTGGTGLTVGTVYYVIASGLTANAFKVSLTAGGSAVDITGDYSTVQYAEVVSDAGNWKNRGTYTCPMNMLIVVGAQAGTIVVSAGDSQFTITVPASTGNRTIRYKGIDKVLTIEENSVETLAMASITWQNSTSWVLIPAGTSPYSVTFNGVTVQTGSHMWFTESWA